MASFTPVASLVGGAMIGLAASLLLLCDGRIAGISGIVGGLLSPVTGDTTWRALFLLGLALGGLAMRLVDPTLVQTQLDLSPRTLAASGLLVGFGTALGSGCTSGHGVCGLSRGSRRSLVATITFIGTGIVMVWFVRHVLDGYRG